MQTNKHQNHPRLIALQLENISKKFESFTAVNSISFSIFRNEIFGLLGPNGAGKTTTINMICGLLPPSEGVISFPEYSQKDYKSVIGYCPQENIFYPKLTCLEQLLFIGKMYNLPSKVINNKALDLLRLLGLNDKVNTKASKLSGGMKRRLNICLALIHDPEIVILDEPEAGLDPQSRILVREVIKLLGKEKTVILTTHNMDEADRLADRIAIVDKGKLLLLDTPQNLKKTVGDGDILELKIEPNIDVEVVTSFVKKTAHLSLTINTKPETILIKHQNILEKLPEIKSISGTCGLNINEFKLRENTLEDVFIHLTGRDLRQ